MLKGGGMRPKRMPFLPSREEARKKREASARARSFEHFLEVFPSSIGIHARSWLGFEVEVVEVDLPRQEVKVKQVTGRRQAYWVHPENLTWDLKKGDPHS